MRLEKGSPAGGSNSDKGTGVPMNDSGKNRERNDDLTEKYTDDDNQIAEGVRTNNPNRNVDKEDATNAGGYRN